MSKIPFSEEELVVKNTQYMCGAECPEFTTPITPKENFERLLKEKNPLWQVTIFDYQYLFPKCVPDNPAKGNVSDEKLPADQLGGLDMFGIDWEYVADIGGSTVRPGKPRLEDANQWKEKIVFPTKEVIDSWDWEGCKATADQKLLVPYLWEPVICTGYFERLVSFMDFEAALIAMIDEDQQDAIHELFDKLSDLYIMLIDKYMEVFPDRIGAVCLHDDWGHQRGLFFSPDTVREMLVPHMKKVNDYVHSKGLYTECHSCGKIDPLIPCFIEAGFDMLECQPLIDFDTAVPQYGDKITLHYSPDIPESGSSKEAYQEAAKKMVDKVVTFKYPVIMEVYYSNPATPAFFEEVYRYSRKVF